MAFGKSFHTLKEARAYRDKQLKSGKGYNSFDYGIRKMVKKNHPRKKKLYHVGTYIDFLNFA